MRARNHDDLIRYGFELLAEEAQLQLDATNPVHVMLAALRGAEQVVEDGDMTRAALLTGLREAQTRAKALATIITEQQRAAVRNVPAAEHTNLIVNPAGGFISRGQIAPLEASRIRWDRLKGGRHG